MNFRNKGIIAMFFDIAIGICVALVYRQFSPSPLVIYHLEFVLSSIITCAATIAGFILTSLSILLGFSSSPLFVYLRKKGYLPELQCRYTASLTFSFAVIFLCVTIGGFAGETNQIGPLWIELGIGTLVTYLLSVLTTGYYILKIIALSSSSSAAIIDNTPSTPKELSSSH